MEKDSNIKKLGRPVKENKEDVVTISIKVPPKKRAELMVWLEERGYKLSPWVRMVVKKETGIDLQ